jgi:hypothetical protein
MPPLFLSLVNYYSWYIVCPVFLMDESEIRSLVGWAQKMFQMDMKRHMDSTGKLDAPPTELIERAARFLEENGLEIVGFKTATETWLMAKTPEGVVSELIDLSSSLDYTHRRQLKLDAFQAFRKKYGIKPKFQTRIDIEIRVKESGTQ